MNGRGVAPLDHEAVVGAVPVLRVGSVAKEMAAVMYAPRPLVVEDLGQVVEIDALSREDHVLAGAVFTIFGEWAGPWPGDTS
jgi:hypothetical protein